MDIQSASVTDHHEPHENYGQVQAHLDANFIPAGVCVYLISVGVPSPAHDVGDQSKYDLGGIILQQNEPPRYGTRKVSNQM